MRGRVFRRIIKVWLPFIAGLFLLSCGSKENDGSELFSDRDSEKIGVLLASHGDIDDLNELEDYIKTAFQQNVGIPLPEWVRGPITSPAYRLSVSNVKSQYDIIGSTHYRSNAQKQMDAVTKALKAKNLSAKAYFGANFATPKIDTVLNQMRADGVTTILVFNKGAQFSYASSGENMDDVLKYLEKNREWDVKVIGTFQYSEDLRFREVWANAVERDLRSQFPGVKDQDICILVGSHGLPLWLTDRGDPAIRQMRRAVDWFKRRFGKNRVYHGFLNDDFFPGASWVSPDGETIAKKMREERCTNVLLDARLSFTTHHRATLYDLNYIARNVLEEPLTPNGPKFAKVVLAPNFDDDRDYAELMAKLSAEALASKGDIIVLKEKGKPALKHGTTSTPGAFADKFKRFTWP